MRRVILIVLLAAITPASACQRDNALTGGNREPRTLDQTSWTDKTELFMEYPLLVTGRPVRFAVHLTQLWGFSALNAGRPSIEMTPEAGGSAIALPGSAPLRPGAFRVEGTMRHPAAIAGF